MTMENPSPEAPNYPPHVIYHASYSFADSGVNESIGRPEFNQFQKQAYEDFFAVVKAGVQTLYDGRLTTTLSFDQLNVFGGEANDFYVPITLALDRWLCDMGCAGAELLDARLTTRQASEEVDDITEIFTAQARGIIHLAAVNSMKSAIAGLAEV